VPLAVCSRVKLAQDSVAYILQQQFQTRVFYGGNILFRHLNDAKSGFIAGFAQRLVGDSRLLTTPGWLRWNLPFRIPLNRQTLSVNHQICLGHCFAGSIVRQRVIGAMTLVAYCLKELRLRGKEAPPVPLNLDMLLPQQSLLLIHLNNSLLGALSWLCKHYRFTSSVGGLFRSCNPSLMHTCMKIIFSDTIGFLIWYCKEILLRIKKYGSLIYGAMVRDSFTAMASNPESVLPFLATVVYHLGLLASVGLFRINLWRNAL
jgi:hypothetical protein